MDNRPENETKDALNPYTEISDTIKEMMARTAIKSPKNGFENKMMAVITIVNAILTKIALTLRFILPGISPGAFKNVPITTAGA
jgi:hypothetical protein